MSNLDWLSSDAYKDMMKRPWFGFPVERSGGGEARYQYECSFVGYALYQADITTIRGEEPSTLMIPLPMHAAWVLQRAEEEMEDRVEITRFVISDSWGVAFLNKQRTRSKWLRDDGGNATQFASKFAALLAAYEYLFPKEERVTIGGKEFTPEQAADLYAGAKVDRKMTKATDAETEISLTDEGEGILKDQERTSPEELKERLKLLEATVKTLCFLVRRDLPDGALRDTLPSYEDKDDQETRT